MILGEWGRRIWYALNQRRFDRELAEEMAAHRELMDEPARFGNALRLREEARDAWIIRWVDEISQDIKHAVRTLARASGFTVIAVVILSLGLGLNLAFFQFLDVVALRPPNVRSPETLVRFDRRGKDFRSSGVPYPATQFIRQHNTVLSAALISRQDRMRWEGDTTPRPVASYVSANWFAELGYAAGRGRVFVESIDEAVDAPSVVVVSDAFWRTRLQHAPDVVGRTVRVNDHPATIVGVAPVDFPDLEFSAHQVELWLLLNQIDRFNPGTDIKDNWGAHSTALYGRLRPGVSAAAAREGLRPTLEELARMRPVEFTPGETLEPHLGTNGFRGPEDTKELLLIASLIGSLTLLVLLVTCANIGNMVLSHTIGGLRELGVRAALGATRWRILRQQLVESLVLAGLGATVGLLLANWSLRAFAAQASLPRYLHLEPDVRTLAVAAAITVLSTLVFGVVPAWMISRRDLVAVMKEGGYGASRGLARTRFRLVLVGAQVMGCCVLLIVAGLVVRSLQRVLVADLGFEFEQVVVMDASPGQSGLGGPAARAYWEAVRQSIEARPEVTMVALTTQAPLGDSVSTTFYNDAHGLAISTARVESPFFELMGIPLITGRNFRLDDDAAGVTIISRRLAMRMYGSLDVLGKVFPKSATGPTIIGITEDAPLVKPGATTVAEQYLPIGRDSYGRMAILARTNGNPAQLLAPMRAAARVADSRVLATAELMRTSYERKLRTRRSASIAAGATGLLALMLACFGIFGVVSYGVSMRTREIGIRRALGAAGPSVIGLVVRQLLFPVITGMLLGIASGLGVGWVLAREPFYLPSSDLLTPLLIMLFFALTATAAAVLPASRALGNEPIRALRHE